MKVVIKATAPTVYQTQSLRAFNIGCNASGNGRYIGEREFDTMWDAKNYLIDRAYIYHDCNPNCKEYKEAIRDIKKGYLTLDAVTAHIEKISNEN